MRLKVLNSATRDYECKFQSFINQCIYEVGETAGRLGDFFGLFHSSFFFNWACGIFRLYSAIFFKYAVTALPSRLDVLQKLL